MQSTLPCSKDIHYFIKYYVKIFDPVKGMVFWDLYPYQNDFLDVCQNHQKILVTRYKRDGLLTLSLVYALWQFAFHANEHITILCKDEEEVARHSKTFDSFLQNIPAMLHCQAVGSLTRKKMMTTNSVVEFTTETRENTTHLIVTEANLLKENKLIFPKITLFSYIYNHKNVENFHPFGMYYMDQAIYPQKFNID